MGRIYRQGFLVRNIQGRQVSFLEYLRSNHYRKCYYDLNNLGNRLDADRKKLEGSVEADEPDIVVWDLEGILDGSSGKIL